MTGAPDPLLAIAPASLRDFRTLLNLERVCFGEDAWPWIDILAAVTFPEAVRIKADWDGRAAGFVIGDRRRSQGLGWIASIGVHPDFRRRGIARLLLERCEAELGLPRIRLTLRRSNLGALSLYRQSGYAEIDVWERYYRNGEDGLVMEKVRRPVEDAAPSGQA